MAVVVLERRGLLGVEGSVVRPLVVVGVADAGMVEVEVEVVLGLVMMRSRTESSSWNRWRLFTMRREKSRVPNCPDTTGSTKGRQSFRAQLLKLTRLLPVCFVKESYTAARKRFQSHASSSAANSGV